MKRLWMLFAAVLVLSFLVLGWVGTESYREMPPIPETVITTDGQAVMEIGTVHLDGGNSPTFCDATVLPRARCAWHPIDWRPWRSQRPFALLAARTPQKCSPLLEIS